MRNNRIAKTKKMIALLLAAGMCVTSAPVNTLAATTSTATAQGTCTNPVVYADVPDEDVIRVGDTYYMVSTTMHLSPGCPIMKSKDLVNWEIVNYCYDILEDSDALALRKGQSAYGKGSWAASLRYNEANQTFYVTVPSSTTGKTYVFSTKDIENGTWDRTAELNGVYHDLSILFDDDGRVYMVYGGSTLRIKEMKPDMTGFKEGGLDKVLIQDLGNEGEGAGYILKGEGAHIQKINGKYYIFIISWPNGKPRTELCYRCDTIDGTYECKTILQDDGSAQGGIIDTPDGKNWYGFIFRDNGAVGRIPILVPVTWENGWPMMGVNGKVPAELEIPVKGMETKSIVQSDEFYQGSKDGVTLDAAEDEVELSDVGKELLINGGAEEGIDPWIANGKANIEVTTEEAATGTHSIKATNRQATGDGPAFDMTKSLVKGGQYKLSVKVKYTTGPDTKNFNICIQPGTNWQYIKDIAHGTAKKGEWKTVETTFTLPETGVGYKEICTNLQSASDEAAEEGYMKKCIAFVETGWVKSPTKENDLFDFYVDDFSIKQLSVPGMIENGNFEDGTTGWSVKDPATIETVAEGVDGGNCLKVTERKGTASGPMQKFTKTLSIGDTLDYSFYIKQGDDAGEDPHTYNLCMYLGSSDWQKIQVAGSVKAKKGEWTLVEGSYVVPESINGKTITDQDLANTSMFIESAWASSENIAANPEVHLADFFVDEISITKKEFNKPGDQPIAGENDKNGSLLKKVWQWNHNPENNGWSLTKRPGYLRLENTTLSTSIQDARNTLTQRTFGPVCSGAVKVDVSNLKNGDYAGLTAFANKYGFVAVKKTGEQKSIVMVSGEGKENKEEEVVELNQDEVYFKIDFNFQNRTDKANFFYSLDGLNWTKIGSELAMVYDLTHFMGYRFGLFNFATKVTGGVADFDYFRVDDKIEGATSGVTTLKATMENPTEIMGTKNAKATIPVSLDSVGKVTDLKVSVNIPKEFEVADVTFGKNVKGKTSYQYKNGQLLMTVDGDGAEFTASANDKLFANITVALKDYIVKDTTYAVKADYVRVSGSDAKFDVSGAVAEISVKGMDVAVAAKKLGYSNPLVDNQFAADPYAITYNGRVYVYMTNDSQQYDADEKDENGIPTCETNPFDKINTISVISSADMVNWTDHGEIAVAGKNNPDGAAKWAACSWAPAACHKTINGKEQFFLYFADGAGGIGVLVADSPEGPFREPAGEGSSRLIYRGMQQAEGVEWLFDPAVLVDDDGTGYLYYGGGVPKGKEDLPETGRVVKLKDNMVEVDGDAVDTKAPALFEDSGIHKYNGKYYLSYCSNFSNNVKETGRGNICYMVSDNPMGPFTYGGIVLENMQKFFDVGGNNHHAFFEFNGKQYVTYHAQTLAKEMGFAKGYRSTHINEVEYDSEGNMKPIIADYKGIAQLKNMDAYTDKIQAETFAWQSGTKVEALEGTNTMLTGIENGDFTSLSGVDFGKKGTAKIAASVNSANGAKIKVCVDDPTVAPVATLDVKATDGKFVTVETALKGITGTHNIFFVFEGEGKDIVSVDYWKFTEDTTTTPVKPPVKATVSLNYSKISLGVKKSTKIVKIKKASPKATIKSAKVDKSSYASVSVKKGVLTITGKKAGKAVVTVTATNGAKAKVTVEVKKTVPTTKLKISKKSVTLKKKGKYTIKTSVLPLTTTDKVTFKTSNKKVATVNSKGQIVAKAKGTAKITVTSGKKKVTCTVKVK